MTPLPRAFLEVPIAHRALHGDGRPENSLAAVRAAVAAGYGIEIDIQPSADGAAMVFHDHDLARMTGGAGPVTAQTVAELGRTPLQGTGETVPTLEEVLAAIDGKVPLLIEIKDQDGALGPGVGPLESAVIRALEGYAGPTALMSFNPHSVAEMARRAPDIPRGLTTCGFSAAEWPEVGDEARARLAAIADYARVGASFISHEAGDLSSHRVAELKSEGAHILCWTIRSPEEEARARGVAVNVTFEGYLPG